MEDTGEVVYTCYRWILLSLDAYICINTQNNIPLHTKQKPIQDWEKNKKKEELIISKTKLQDTQTLPTENLKLIKMYLRYISEATSLCYLLPNNSSVITPVKLFCNCSSASYNKKQPTVHNLRGNSLIWNMKLPFWRRKQIPLPKFKKKKKRQIYFKLFYFLENCFCLWRNNTLRTIICFHKVFFLFTCFFTEVSQKLLFPNVLGHAAPVQSVKKLWKC